MTHTPRLIRIFFSYSRADAKLLQPLLEHLFPLRDQGLIDVWYDEQMVAGEQWPTELDKQLDAADIVVLLCSASFFSSPHCRREMQRALALRVETGKQVVPVLGRAVDWEATPLKDINRLPRDGTPLGSHPDPDQAFSLVAREIRGLVATLSSNEAASLDRLGRAAELQQRGLNALRLGKLRSARDLITRACALLERDGGALSGPIAVCSSHLGEVFRLMGNLDLALEFSRRAVDLPQGPDENPRDRVARLCNLSLVHIDRRELGVARQRLAEALIVSSRTQIDDSAESAAVLHNLALVHFDCAEIAEAETCIRQALAIDESYYGKGHPEVELDRSTLDLVVTARGGLR